MLTSPIATEKQLRATMGAAEGEHLEFKTTLKEKDVFRYCVALCNEGGGNLVLGVSNRPPRRIVGTDCFGDVNAVKRQLLDVLHVRIDVYEISMPEGRVVTLCCPSRPAGTPLAYRGKYLMRVGESLVAMTPERLSGIFAETAPDFSRLICAQGAMADLAPEAIEEFRKRWADKSNNPELRTKPAAQLLEDAQLASAGQLTYAALILLAKPESLTRLLPNAEVIYEYRSSDATIEYQDRKEYRAGLLL